MDIRYKVVFRSELDGLEVFCYGGSFEECCSFAEKKSKLQALTLFVLPDLKEVCFVNGQKKDV